MGYSCNVLVISMVVVGFLLLTENTINVPVGEGGVTDKKM
jgi:hypothetical protein